MTLFDFLSVPLGIVISCSCENDQHTQNTNGESAQLTRNVLSSKTWALHTSAFAIGIHQGVSLTLICRPRGEGGGGGNLTPRQFSVYCSKTVGARVLKL